MAVTAQLLAASQMQSASLHRASAAPGIAHLFCLEGCPCCLQCLHLGLIHSGCSLGCCQLSCPGIPIENMTECGEGMCVVVACESHGEHGVE